LINYFFSVLAELQDLKRWKGKKKEKKEEEITVNNQCQMGSKQEKPRKLVGTHPTYRISKD
jgi:hypothetical protein